jgi:hypothetical protein
VILVFVNEELRVISRYVKWVIETSHQAADAVGAGIVCISIESIEFYRVYGCVLGVINSVLRHPLKLRMVKV